MIRRQDIPVGLGGVRIVGNAPHAADTLQESAASFPARQKNIHTL